MNILLILTDEQRADCLGCAGNSILQTPHLDALAARGYHATRHTCSTPVCTPSRASIMTGHYARTHGAVSVGYQLAREASGLEDIVLPTIADYLSEAGYQCGLFGKSHLEAEVTGFADHLDPEQPYYGFQQHALAEDAPFGPYWTMLKEHHPELVAEAMKQVNEEFQDLPYADNNPRLNAVVPVNIPEELSVNNWITDQTIQFICQQDQPFCAVCSFVDPHHPWSPVGKYATMYQPEDIPLPPQAANDPPSVEAFPYSHQPGMTDAGYQEMIAAYYGMITHIDDQVGRLVQTLEDQGVLDDTLIIFTSDHGDYNGDRKLIRKGPSLMGSLLYTPFIAAARTPYSRVKANNSASMKTWCRPCLMLLALPFRITFQGPAFYHFGRGMPRLTKHVHIIISCIM